jgi:hypothetical protein
MTITSQIRITTNTQVFPAPNNHAHLEEPIQQPGKDVHQIIHLQVTDYDAYGNLIVQNFVDLNVTVPNVMRAWRITFGLDRDDSKRRSTLVFRLAVIRDGAQVFNKSASLSEWMGAVYTKYISYTRTNRPPGTY